MNNAFSKKYGPWSLVTGAARGLGKEFALQCAERGLNVLMADIREKELTEAAASIRNKTGREIKTITIDLSDEKFLEKITAAADKFDIGLLINNAGISTVRSFLDWNSRDLISQLNVNTRAPLLLTHHLTPAMLRRGKGGIIFVSSASAQSGGGSIANYAGTKAYNMILGESLWYELRPHGIDVMGFLPGVTESPGLRDNNPDSASGIQIMPARKAVTEALGSLGKHPTYIPGVKNRFAFRFLKLLPRKTVITMVSKTIEKYFKLDREKDCGTREKK